MGEINLYLTSLTPIYNESDFLDRRNPKGSISKPIMTNRYAKSPPSLELASKGAKLMNTFDSQ